MLKKLILAAGVAIAGVIMHKMFKSKASEDLADDACETMHDILKEGRNKKMKESVSNKTHDILDAGETILNSITDPQIHGRDLHMCSRLIEDSYKETFINNQFKYNTLYRNFTTAGVFSVIFSLILFGISLKFREIGNSVYERDLAMHATAESNT